MKPVDPIITEYVEHMIPAAKTIVSHMNVMYAKAFFLIKDPRYRKYPNLELPGFDSFLEKPPMLKILINRLWAAYKQEAEAEQQPHELIALVTFVDTYIEDIKDVHLDEDGRRLNRFVPGPDQPEAIIAQVYQRDRQFQYQYAYKKVAHKCIFKPVELIETAKSPQARLSNLWPEGA